MERSDTAREGAEDQSAEMEQIKRGKIDEDLHNDGYRRTQSECHEDDCEGVLWYDRHTVVCAECATIVDMDDRRRSPSKDDADLWDEYFSSRPEYPVSGRVRLPGGFLKPYEWVTPEDVDHPVRSLDPDSFYL